jgi:hypothetical protein
VVTQGGEIETSWPAAPGGNELYHQVLPSRQCMYPRSDLQEAGIDASLPGIACLWLSLLPLQEDDGAIRQMIWERDRLVALIAYSDRDRFICLIEQFIGV